MHAHGLLPGEDVAQVVGAEVLANTLAPGVGRDACVLVRQADKVVLKRAHRVAAALHCQVDWVGDRSS